MAHFGQVPASPTRDPQATVLWLGLGRGHRCECQRCPHFTPLYHHFNQRLWIHISGCRKVSPAMPQSSLPSTHLSATWVKTESCSSLCG